jgi:hypothetical protein
VKSGVTAASSSSQFSIGVTSTATLGPKLDPPSNGHRLYLAAGSAAEKVIFREADLQASGQDRRLFGNPQDTTFDEKVAEAEVILLKLKPRLERLAYRLDGMYKESGGDFSGFRSQQADLGDGIKDHWVLLDEEELKEELKDVDEAGRNAY